MRVRPLIAAVAASTFLLSACGGGEDTAVNSANQNPLLELIPADTPFVIANLQPVPANVVDAYVERMAPMFLEMQSGFAELRAELDDSAMNAQSDQESDALLKAVLDELDGKMNREGLESLGLSLETLSALYGHGLFPVLRAGIGDAEKVRAMVARVEANAGQAIPEQTFQGTAYWRIAEPDMPMAVYLAILEDHVVIAAAPTEQEAAFLPSLLALETPAESLADSNRLAELNNDKGFEPYGSGYIELSRVVDEMFNADSVTASWMSDMGEFDLANVDPACELEARLITTFVPRLVMGTTEITADRINMRYQVETNTLLGGQLARLVSDVPAAAEGGSNVVNASMSVEMGQLREFLLNSANAIAAAPFRCPQMQDINGQVQQMAEAINQPMPPFLGNLKGFRAELTELDPNAPEPENMRGLLSLEMESPQMVVGMASMMIPGFENLNIEPGGDPVELPQDLMMVSTPEMEVYAVMSKDAIGISLGKGQKEQLRPFLDQKGDPDGVFLSFEYDMALLSELGVQQNDWQQGYDDSTDPGYADGPDVDLEAMMESYQAWLGRSRVELRFDGNGLTVDNLQTFR